VSTCGSTVSQNCSYIQNPSYTSTYSTTGDCAYSVTPISGCEICQIRLDFDNFDITDAATGQCTDYLTMTGPTGRNPEPLCGTLTGMHIYIEQGRSLTATTLTFTIATGGTWNIKVSQIECSSLMRAPVDCQQYFTGTSGTTQSYNWPTVQLAGRVDATCFRKNKGYCGIEYSQYGGGSATPDSFYLGAVTATSNNLIAGTAQWLTIPGTDGPVNYSGGLLCEDVGITCNQAGAVLSSSFAFAHTVTNGDATGHLGYKLNWIQTACGGPGNSIGN